MLEHEYLNPVGRANLLEPIIVSGKYFNIKLLSAYDFMLCTKMLDELTKMFINQNFEKKLSNNICQYACLVSLCLYNSKKQKVFNSPIDALKNLTPSEIFLIYSEYKKLLKKIYNKDKISYSILEKVKKHHNNKLNYFLK
ncbi:MAG: hypothetical protein IJJ04_00850 [Clostridia bacterium]|nr:hypothetical protein [Clostridia bacterium]